MMNTLGTIVAIGIGIALICGRVWLNGRLRRH